jgi:hypothetical protein
MANYPGRKGMVYLSSSGTGTATNTLSLNQWTLNRTTDKIETTSFGNTNKTYVSGLPDLQGTFAGFWNDAETKPFAGSTSSDGVIVYLYPSADCPTKYAWGPAWLDVSIDTSVGGAVTISGNFAANGSWGVAL